MRILDQTLESVVEGLSPLDVEWMDQTASSAIARLAALPKKSRYTSDDMAHLLEDDFEVGILCARSFLGLSKDTMDAELRRVLGRGNTGVTYFKKDREAFLKACREQLLLRATPVPTQAASFETALVERARKELANYVGPLAKVVVDRALKKAHSTEELIAMLAAEIDGTSDRQKFLKSFR